MGICNTCINEKSKDIFYKTLTHKGVIAPLDLKDNPCCYCKYLFENDLYKAKLKNCPFCGGQGEVRTTIWGDSDKETYCVVCENCEIETGWFDTKKEAIDFWNRRV